MYNKQALQLPTTIVRNIFISALNGRLCQKSFLTDVGFGVPQPSFFSGENK
jgi:hypothetical protein